MRIVCRRAPSIDGARGHGRRHGGRSAGAALEQSRPDVLLFGDLALQGEIAYDLMRTVTARAAPLPVASFSSWRAEDREREMAAGFRLHLAKPLDVGALVDAVADLAGRRS